MKKGMLKMLFLTALFAANVTAAAQSGNGNVFTIKIGDNKLILLSEGNSPRENQITLNASEEDLQKYLPNGKYTVAVNTFLWVTPDSKVLIDTGFGRELFKNMESIGVKPEEIDAVLLTHMHGDHIAGLLRDGKRAFPNAKVYLAQKELDYWRDKPENFDKLKPYMADIKTIEPDTIENGGLKILPGVSAIASYGHTPGHTMYLVESKGEKALVWGDTVNMAVLQIPVPGVYVTHDIDKAASVISRQKALSYAAKEGLIVAAAHIEIPGMCKIVKDEATGKYSFVLHK